MSDNWMPEPGEAVVMVRNDRYHKAVIADEVVRVGKRDIVLASGERFRVRDLTKENGSGWSITYTKLMRPEDPVVDRLRAEIRHAQLVRSARNACHDYLYKKDGVTEYDVILALAPLTGIRDLIAEYDSEASA